MMASIDSSGASSVIWCVLQVSLLAGVGIIGSWFVSKRNAFTASSIVYAAVTVSGILTLLAPLPIHQYFVIGSRPQETSDNQTINPISQAGKQENLASPDLKHADARMLWIDLQSAGSAVRSVLKKVDVLEKGPISWLRWVRSLLTLAIAVGLLRFAAGTTFVIRIRRNSRLVSDDRVSSTLRELIFSFNCRKTVEVREHSEFTDAAVAGWLHPVLILPCDWRQWSDDELRSVVAHELAHIVRGDSIWRFITSGLSTIHLYNPLVYWLLRRVIFYQELAADALAAAVIGQKVYLCSLSRLAIRQDDLSRGTISPDMLPVFSGHLIRRIKMLNSKDGHSMASESKKHNGKSAAISAAFFLMGLASLATRGIAEPPAVDQPAKKGSVKNISFVKPNAESRTRQTADPTQGMFQHSPLNSATGPNHSDGMMVIRMRELLQHPEVQTYTSALNGLLSQGLSAALKSDTVPDVHFESIEWIAATPRFSVIEQTNDKSDRNHRVMMGLSEAVIKFNQPIDLKGWMERFAPNAKEQEVEGRIVFELELPFLGPQPCFVWQSDETTLRTRASTNEFSAAGRATFKDVRESIKSSESPASTATCAWVPTWNRTDAGLISIVLSAADLSGVNDNFYEKCEKEGPLAIAAGNFIRELRSGCKTTAILLDLANGSDIGIRFSLVHESRDSASQSAKQLEELAELVKVELDNRFQKLDSSDPKNTGEITRNRCLDQAFRIGYGSVQEHADGTSSLDVSTVIPLQKLIEVISQND